MFQNLLSLLAFSNISLRYEAATQKFVVSQKGDPTKTKKYSHEEWQALCTDATAYQTEAKNADEVISKLTLNAGDEPAK